MAVDTASRNGLRRAAYSRLASWDTAIIVVTIVVIAVAAVTTANFGTARNATFLILDLAPLLMMALPVTLIIVTGEIDLSVASTLGLTSAAMGVMWTSGLPLETIMPLCVVLGALLGALNGFLVTVFGLPSLAVTIGTLALYRGMAYVLLGDTAVADFPRDFTGWVIGTIPGTSIPNIVLPLALLTAVFAVVLHATPTGRAVYAAGANKTAAHFAGVSVPKLKFWLFVASGAVAGLAGVFWTLRYSSARGDNAYGLELAVVASVLLGGVSIFGGKGALPGVIAGVVLLASLQNALRLASVSTEALVVVTGLLLILSVLAANAASAISAAVKKQQRQREALVRTSTRKER